MDGGPSDTLSVFLLTLRLSLRMNGQQEIISRAVQMNIHEKDNCKRRGLLNQHEGKDCAFDER